MSFNVLRTRVILFLSLAVTIGGLGFVLFKSLNLNTQPEAMLAELGQEVSNTKLSAVHHVAKRDGVREWALDAESARYQKDRNRTILEGVTVTFFGKDDNTIQVTGAEGVLHTASMNIDVFGDVVVESGSRKLTTERLHYNHETRCVSTNTPVRITDEGVTLAGNSMRFSLAKKAGSVWGDVRAVFDRPETSFVGS